MHLVLFYTPHFTREQCGKEGRLGGEALSDNPAEPLASALKLQLCREPGPLSVMQLFCASQEQMLNEGWGWELTWTSSMAPRKSTN